MENGSGMNKILLKEKLTHCRFKGTGKK